MWFDLLETEITHHKLSEKALSLNESKIEQCTRHVCGNSQFLSFKKRKGRSVTICDSETL